MSKKDVIDTAVDTSVKDTSVEEAKAPEAFKFGTSPALIINMIREQRVYRFEMPIGAKLAECKEAANECINVIDKMIEQSNKLEEEDKLKKESSDPIEEVETEIV